jgi:hypothetical protein
VTKCVSTRFVERNDHYKLQMNKSSIKINNVIFILQLKECNPFFMGDSSELVQGRKIEAFCDALDEVIAENSRNKSY